jgi:hypothetical protein
MRKMFVLLAAAGLVGCAHQQQQQQTRPTARDDPSNGCFAELAFDARFVPLREKMAINLHPSKPTLDMLADRSYVTDEEKRLIGVWQVARDACTDRGESFRAAYAPPEYRANIATGQVRLNNLTAKLYAREITFGEFNRARSENAADMQARGAAVEQREKEAAAAAQARDEANRRAAVGAALQNMQTQQLIQQQQQQQLLEQNRMRTTNCTRVGNQTNCTTY